jgi:hypothetical protein
MKGKRQVLGSWFKAVACGGVMLGALSAGAADFSVGRVDIRFAEEGWKEVALPDQSQAYGGEMDGALAVQAKLYVLEARGDEGQTLVLVSTNSQGLGGGRGGYMTYTPNCKSDAQNHREGNEGFNARFFQCLTVTPLYSSDSVFQALAPQVLDMQTAGVVSVRRPVYTVWSRHAISTGSFVDVRVFVTSPLGAEGASVPETLPGGVLPANVAWGRQLKDAVKSSVHSLSGRLVVPAIRPTAQTSGGAVSGG